MLIERIADWFTTADLDEIDDEMVAYYQENPDEIAKIEKEGRVHRIVLPIGFTVGLILVMGSKLIRFYDIFGGALFLNEIIVDLAFELGVALWGGVITAAFLETIENRERAANRRFREEIERRIKVAASQPQTPTN